jgi:metal-responsive CopG/Arc/MetJ family transcriptional regulator
MKRLNITIADNLYQELESVPNKSRIISEALREKLERDRGKKLDALLVEGYQASKNEDMKLAEEWEKITLEGWE